MSGGNFDFLYFKIEEQPLDFFVLENLENMAAWLGAAEQNQPEAAKELAELHQFLLQTRDEINKRLPRKLLDVIKQAEWWCSHDIGQDTFEAVWRKYKGD